MFTSTRCHQKRKVFKNALWQNVHKEKAQVLFDRMNNYTDHLGNVRLSYTQDPQTGALAILEENHYYPFGLQHKNYNSDITKIDLLPQQNNEKGLKETAPPLLPLQNPGYMYKYNGKELQDELGLDWYEYGSRMYMPDLGRFTTVDPYAYVYQSYSPYLYALNNPIRFEDTEGEGPGDRVKKAKSFNGTPYSMGSDNYGDNRTANTPAALKTIDCSELVYRVLAADGITNGVQLGNTSTLKSFLNNDENFIKSQSPEVGDIFLWRSSGNGHTGIVTGIIKDDDGNIISVEITHAKGKKYGTLTEEKALSYFSESTRKGWEGFFRPKVETPDQGGETINLSGLSAREKAEKLRNAIEDLRAWTEKVIKKQEERQRRREERQRRREERRKNTEQEN